MHILIDLQALQSESSGARGIVRYTRALIEGIIRVAPDDRITLLMSGMIGKKNGQLRRALAGLRSDIDIQMWTAGTPISFMSDKHRRHAAEEMFKAKVSQINPDVFLIPSLFEGMLDDVSVTFGDLPTAIVLYDMIPLVFRDIYLDGNDIATWYDEKVEDLKRADLLLAISDFTAEDGRKYLKVPADRIVAVGTDADALFFKQDIDPDQWAKISYDLGLTRPFLM